MGDDTGSCLSNTIICGNCQADQVCVYGSCQTCKSCQNGTLTATAASSVWGSNIQVSLVSTVTGGVVNDGQWAVLSTAATSLTLGVLSANSTQAGIYIKDGSAITVSGAITTRAANGGIVVQAGGTLTAGSIVVPSGLTTTVAFESLETKLATPTNAWVKIAGVSVTGDLVLAGLGRVIFPAGTNAITIGTGALVTAAGNVSLSGNLATLPLYIGYVASQSGDARALNLTTTGTILGSSSDSLFVTGTLTYGGPIIQPILVVSGTSSSATITSLSLKAGEVSLTRGGSVIITNPGTTLSFSQFVDCDAQSLIIVKVSSISALREGNYVVARFETVSQTAADVLCWIKLVDATGASVLLPHAQTIYVDPEEGGSGRRLLSMRQSSADSREAYRVHGRWTPQGYVVPTNGNSTFDYNNKVITYSYTKTVSYTYVSGAASVVPALATLVAIIAGVMGRHML